MLIISLRPLLFVGPTGTGKSVYVKDKLMNHLEKDLYFPFYVNFSARTSANQVQVSSKLEIWIYHFYFFSLFD